MNTYNDGLKQHEKRNCKRIIDKYNKLKYNLWPPAIYAYEPNLCTQTPDGRLFCDVYICPFPESPFMWSTADYLMFYVTDHLLVRNHHVQITQINVCLSFNLAARCTFQCYERNSLSSVRPCVNHSLDHKRHRQLRDPNRTGWCLVCTSRSGAAIVFVLYTIELWGNIVILCDRDRKNRQLRVNVPKCVPILTGHFNMIMSRSAEGGGD